MIITKTPFRISLAGGGTDFKSFYKNRDGKVLSFTIDKFIYVMVKRQLGIVDYKYKITWSRVEFCNKINEIEHPIVRETLKYFKINYPIEISTYADVPSNTGLGSSSSFAVGLVNAISALQNIKLSKHRIAEIASKIEVDILKRPMGRQDHYASCFGGINKITFKKSKILVKPLIKSEKFLEIVKNNFFLFYTNMRRDSSDVLKKQLNINKKQEVVLCKMRDQVDQIESLIEKKKDLSEIGNILDQGWSLKRSISSKISNSKIEKYYNLAIKNGSLGGKLCGAGGGGFLLIFIPKNKKKKILNVLNNLFRLNFNLEFKGTQITHNSKYAKK